MSDSKEKAAAVPAATIVIIRDTPAGMEVFMVKRHHQIDFVAGALVFPGGKVAAGDFDAALEGHIDGARDWTVEQRALGAAAIREAFEESGILFAREEGSESLVSAERADRLARYRSALDKKEISLLAMLREEKLRLACDQLAHFAHWITPRMMPKRFDTHFYLASAPAGHAGLHDGQEAVDSIWISPEQAINDRKKWNVIFPTKLNLMKLAKARSVGEAISAARATSPVTVEPWVEQAENGNILRIRDDAGYEQTWTSMKEAM